VTFRVKMVAALAVLGLVGIATTAVAHDRWFGFRANISGYEEIPTLSTDANGSFKAWLANNGEEIRYELRYKGPFNANNVAAGSAVTQSHIHLGARAFNGGIIVFLCANPPAAPPAGVPTPPACPATEGTVTGTLTKANVIGPAAQGIAAGEFAELVRAMRAGAAYVNIHTASFAAGEIRGQIKGSGRGKSRGKDD
jgi:hypothetical protein